jgi:hypothetical protein
MIRQGPLKLMHRGRGQMSPAVPVDAANHNAHFCRMAEVSVNRSSSNSLQEHSWISIAPSSTEHSHPHTLLLDLILFLSPIPSHQLLSVLVHTQAFSCFASRNQRRIPRRSNSVIEICCPIIPHRSQEIFLIRFSRLFFPEAVGYRPVSAMRFEPSKGRSLVFLILGLLGQGALAHDHHGSESNIPEGQTVSLEPLVRRPALWTKQLR